MNSFFWIIGSPRSGTTYLTDLLGKNVDKYYNEPWNTHHLHKVETWKFPKNKTIVFKYCENWRNYHFIKNNFTNNTFIHVYRNPDDVVYSMAFPKENSYPPRDLYGEYEGMEKINLCMERWYNNMINCCEIDLIDKNYYEVRYENIEDDIKEIPIKIKENIKFENRNINPILPWKGKYKELRNLIVANKNLNKISKIVNDYKQRKIIL